MKTYEPVAYKFSEEAPVMPAGKYYVIDPCYVFQNADSESNSTFWDDFCAFCFPVGNKGEGRNPIMATVDALPVFIFSTAYGDGEYPVTDGKVSGTAGVDAGVLALIPKKLIDQVPKTAKLGVLVTLKENSIPKYDKGDMNCGNIWVYTNDELEEEENWDY